MGPPSLSGQNFFLNGVKRNLTSQTAGRIGVVNTAPVFILPQAALEISLMARLKLSWT
jgi:hypothetical protein